MIETKIENGKLVVTLPINEPLQRSKTGKTFVVASTHGNQPTTV